MMEKEKFLRFWNKLTSDLQSNRDIESSKPLLVHYTTIDVIQKILTKPCLWMSSPLNMNDHQEVGFLINRAILEIHASPLLRDAFDSESVHREFLSALNGQYDYFDTEEVLNLFITCFSEHDPSELPDGKLSMWRGYGDFGNGAAIAFDTGALVLEQNSPLILSEVRYLTNEEIVERIRDMICRLAAAIKSETISIDEAGGLAHVVFRRVALAAVFAKHRGFKEEREWRLVYMPNLDSSDRFTGMIDFFNGPKGLEPKLKLALTEDQGPGSLRLDFENVVHSIIIGPRAASPLSKRAASILLDKIEKPNLKPKLQVSTIPFRT